MTQCVIVMGYRLFVCFVLTIVVGLFKRFHLNEPVVIFNDYLINTLPLKGHLFLIFLFVCLSFLFLLFFVDTMIWMLTHTLSNYYSFFFQIPSLIFIWSFVAL